MTDQSRSPHYLLCHQHPACQGADRQSRIPRADTKNLNIPKRNYKPPETASVPGPDASHTRQADHRHRHATVGPQAADRRHSPGQYWL